MNDYDFSALDIIVGYHKKHGKYPKQIEVTTVYREEMSCAYLDFEEPAEEPRTVIVTRVPVLPLGTGDIVFRRLLVRNTDINQQRAEYATAEQFQRLGAKLARAGCLIVEPKESSGQQNLPPFLFFSQIEVWIFGEEAAFDEVLADRLREEQE